MAIDEDIDGEYLHGRKTTRHTQVYPVPTELLPDWRGVKHIIAVTRSGERLEGKKSRRRVVKFHERHYYLSSLDWSAREFSGAIRGHWSIENQLHWVKDVTLNEDNCVHRGGNSPANWAMVRQFLVSLARHFDTRTLPESLRLMSNQLLLVFDLL